MKNFHPFFKFKFSSHMPLTPYKWLIFIFFNSVGFMDFVLVSSFVFILDIYFSLKKSLLINSNAEKTCCNFSLKNLFKNVGIMHASRLWSFYSTKFQIRLHRKSKTWFFTFVNVYVCWIKLDKILMSQISPPKSRYFADQSERTKVGPHENEFWQFSNTKMNITNRAQKVDEKMASFV